MLASAWRMIGESLEKLEEEGLEDGNAREELKKNGKMRARYLTLYDTVNVLAQASQERLGLLATSSRKYKPRTISAYRFNTLQPSSRVTSRQTRTQIPNKLIMCFNMSF